MVDTSPLVTARNENDWETFDQRLQGLLDNSSRTFAYIIPKFSRDLRRWIGAAYLGARIIDEVEDSRLAQRDKEYLMKRVPIVLRGSAHDERASLAKLLEGIAGEKQEGYQQLLTNIEFVHSALGRFPGNVQDIIRNCYEEMANGLANPRVQAIATLADHHLYCHYAAGTVGFMVTRLAREAGVVDERTMHNMMPPLDRMSNQEEWRLGANPAHDFGVALQLINDIRDLHTDYKEGIQRWPSELLSARGVTVEQLVHATKQDGALLEKGQWILEDQLADAKRYILAGARWIDLLGYEDEGFRVGWSDALAMSAATWRSIRTPRFFYDESVRKIEPEELYVIDGVNGALTKRHKPVVEFIEHLLEQPASEYRVD